MADGDFIPTDGDTQTDQGTWLKHLSLGTKNYTHEPTDFNSVPIMHRASMQMVQVAAGHRWCPQCGDVRPNEMFNTTCFDRGTWRLILQAILFEVDVFNASPFLNALAARVLGKYFPICRSCQMNYKPETLWLQWCNRCSKWLEWTEFYNEYSWLCVPHTADYNSERYELRVGYKPRAYAR
jgi:hypothetical protein